MPDLRTLKSAIAAARAASIHTQADTFVFAFCGEWLVRPQPPSHLPHFRVNGTRTNFIGKDGRERAAVVLS